MIRDARVLRAGFVPREVEHRDAEVNHLSSVLEPITNGEPADTAIVTGPSGAGALTKYFGKVAGDDDFKVRGIEARQHSTPPFIEDVQRDCLDQLDATRSPDAVLGRLERAIDELQAGTVAVERLVERNRVSKPLEGYSQNTQNVAALKRAREQDLAVHAGQDIEFVVVNDEKSSRDRVALAHEEIETYDASYYETQLVRAIESILAPLDWDRNDIRRELNGTHIVGITDWT